MSAGMAEQILFDKLVFVDRLTRAGISEEQARAQAEALHEALRDSVATKADMHAEIARLESRIELAVRDLTIRGRIITAAAIGILASMKYFGG